MKRLRLVGVLVFILLIGTLAGCNDEASESEVNRIAVSDLNSREEAILSTTAGASSVFNFTNTSYEEVAVWIEKYQSGELVEDEIGSIKTLAADKGSIILAAGKAVDDEKSQVYHIGIGDESGTSSTSFIIKNPSNSNKMSVMYGELSQEQALNQKELVLATIAYSNENEQGISSIPVDFYENPKAHLDVLKKYSTVYVIKAKFSG